MSSWRKWLSRLLSRNREQDKLDAARLRLDFKARYQSFKLLLSANHRSLELMAEIERVLSGIRPFGMTFVRSRCTRISTLVFQIVKHLDGLAPGRYAELFEKFESIHDEIKSHLQIRKDVVEGPLTVPLEEIDRDMTDGVGQKMASLAEVKNRFDVKVPGGFVITATAYHRFMEHGGLQMEINRRLQAADVSKRDELFDLSAGIQRLIIASEIPIELEREIEAQVACLDAAGESGGGPLSVAMRSSALGEDRAGVSFAGQYRTLLNVGRENVLHAYKEIVAGKYGLAAMTYRLNRGIVDEEAAMCVGCLQMIDVLSGGVMYSRNPIDIRNESILINSVWGLPKPVVDGRIEADLFVLDRNDPPDITVREIAIKEYKFVSFLEEGVGRMVVTGEERNLPSLTDEQARELARMGMKLEAYYGTPQDIEWAIARGGEIVLLQCRPLHAQVTDPEIEGDSGNGGDLENGLVSGSDRDSRTTRKWQVGEPPGPVRLRGGVTASPGAAAGPVFKVEKSADSLRFPQGAVLVTTQSLPAWASLVGNAVAVVSEVGGVTGHLASVAREFGIPALFGARGAMKRLVNGEIVTVDADGMHVFDGRIEALVDEERQPRNLMEGSAVFETLKSVAQCITPLNLLDPDAPGFRPFGCGTLHDITRFCHEKAVAEMFRFGKDHRFPERSSKQLYCDAPMQWWVLNLDDGFTEEVEGRYVGLDNIVSIPMLAIWEGVAAIPWEGPPPIDRKGLMSVMFEATRNTALTPGLRTRYANRNYFMISRNYCSLSSRLGFHFSTIETLVSDRPRENYISFQFKGGAADFDRRLKRVRFVGDILENYGFRVEVKEDNLRARVENRGMVYMSERLKILGYLTIHTRQLDMIMSNASAVGHFRTKLERDIQELLNGGSGFEPSS